MPDAVSQKEFYETMQRVTKEISDVTIEMAETKTLIRDYNGLRQTINDVGDRVQKLENSRNNKKEYRQYIGWLVGIISTLLAISAYIQ
ncbi:hypothetical protein SH1V18_02800 [Vallitalea longa]|uniref:Uncharacterized protein n=1 Tax=Vallitalea longa TaxID=2936439 RepID=A0A9W5Y8B5_9FIRM|nr:hypothetical protein [Vallitalea longa]GKX27800.1 hypothetical protein SH1V18_02800 [Vallitalea longa]